MAKFVIIALIIFSIMFYLVAKLSLIYSRKESGEKMWSLWGIRTMYLEGVIIVSGLLTALIMYIIV